MTGSRMMLGAALMVCFIAGALTKTLGQRPRNGTDAMDKDKFDASSWEGRGEECVEALKERNMKIRRVVKAGRGRCELDPNDDLNLRVKELCDEPQDKTPCGFLAIAPKSEAEFEAGDSDATPNVRRKRLVKDGNKWNKGVVPYVISGGDTASIKRAMATYERFTCFRFVPWYSGIENDLGLGHTAYLNFGTGGGCYSTQGRSSAAQGISCCSDTVCIHEIGHALGAYHEHQNPKGEGIIYLQPQNVQSAYVHNYEEVAEGTGFSTGYDFNSIMHYDPWGFANGNGDTIKYLFSDLPGGDEWYYLMQELSLNHQCGETYCADFTMECVNDGYKTLVDNTCACMCPQGLDPLTGCATVLGEPAASEICEETDLESWHWKFYEFEQTQASEIKSLTLVNEHYDHTVICKPDESFGVNGTTLWVSKGCRGTFSMCYIPSGGAGASSEERSGDWYAAAAWPAGQYAMPAPATGCPDEQFTSGSVVESGAAPATCVDNDPRGCPYWGWSGCINNPTWMNKECPVTCQRCPLFASHTSTPAYLGGTTNGDGVEHQFCTKETSGSPGGKWPAGQYCIYRQGGACPEGFSTGSASFTDEAHSDVVNSVSGSVPDGEFGEASTKFEFCCNDLGFSTDELVLPPTQPFSLLKKGGTCQAVKGMNVYTGYTAVKSVAAPTLSGTHPVTSVDSAKNIYGIQYCYYVPTHMDCGGAITLTKENPTASLSGTNGTDQLCNWFIKAPEGSRVILNFASFNIECVDKLTLKFMRPGQPGNVICGSSYSKSTTSIFNTMSVTYETEDVGNSNFEATVSLLDSSSLCYNAADHGQTYAGQMNITRAFRQCLSWAETGHCDHSPFREDYIDENLEDNYCRTPHERDGLMPWCYYEASGCKRDYCDVCSAEKVYDTTDGCESLKATGFCDNDPTAQEKCAYTCRDSLVQYDVLPAASSVTCGDPGSVVDGDMVGEVKATYAVGDRVTFQCKTSSSSRDKRCLTTGEWSSINYVCSACDDGWTLYDGDCYVFNENKVKHPEAVQACEALDAQMTTSTSSEENAFLSGMHAWEGLWLAGGDGETEGTWKWSDGEAVGPYTNWKSGEPDNWYNEDCIYMNNNGQWEDQWCTNEWKPYVCKKAAHDVSICDDVTDVCKNLYKNNPSVCTSQATFMDRMCRDTCGLCTPATCTVEPATGDATIVGSDSSIVQGGSVTYQCAEGAVYISGDYVRGCKADGALTGESLVCEGVNEVVMDHRAMDGSGAGSKYKDNTMYVSDNPYSQVPVAGKITRWEFYSDHEGEQAFQVWRKAGSNTNYEFVGQNVFSSPAAARTSYTVPEADQISVLEGDLLGIYYGLPKGGVKYYKCDGSANPSFKLKTYKLKETFADPTTLAAGTTKTFVSETREQCRMYKFTAVIEPTEE